MRGLLCAAMAVFAAGTAAMLFADRGSRFYLAVTYAAMPCLGCLGGAVYRRMSRASAAGEKTARSMGIGSAVAAPSAADSAMSRLTALSRSPETSHRCQFPM